MMKPPTEAELKARLTPEFLETLRHCIGYVGWSVDMVESSRFAMQVHELAGADPELVPNQPYSDLEDAQESSPNNPEGE